MNQAIRETIAEYHYTESGLDNVYLVNGFQYVDTPRGRHVVIEDIDGLHRAIGEMLITLRKNLSGKEIKFLRQEMLTSQATLARLLGVSERAVIRWESGKTGQVPGPAEATMRMLYRDFLDDGRRGSGAMRRMLKKIADMENEMHRVALRKPGTASWRPDFSDVADERQSEDDRQLELTAV